MKTSPFRAGVAALFCLSALTCAASASAQIRLPKALGDHAVLQRGVPIHIWGWATPGTSVVVQMHAQSAKTIVDRLGEWSAWLAPEAAGGPYTLTVSPDGPAAASDAAPEQPKTSSDILVGDVWLASGQSNMEISLSGYATAPVKDGPAEIKAATNPQIHLLLVGQNSSDYPLDDLKNGWTQTTPETAATFSAVAYLFAHQISLKEHVPIGIIAAAWGGVPVDSFISLEGLSHSSATLSAFAYRAHFADELADRDAVIAAEKRDADAAKAAGKPAPPPAWHAPGISWLPAGPYNGMIAPLTKYSIKGFLWYQGESDTSAERAPHYTDLFEALIRDWRSHFAQGNLPFLYVQISSFTADGGWGMVRDAQRRTLAVDNTAMAVITDVGDPGNVHPTDKHTVATRLALAARTLVYGEDVASVSPLFRQATTELTPQGPAMRVWFDHAKGLTTHGGVPEGFEIAGADHHFVAAQATIEGETVIVKSSSVTEPRYVRYGWSGVVPPALYNAAGLPASTFSSEPTPTL